jgi:uncharacterized glyoxalase superfamily protein PhnB
MEEVSPNLCMSPILSNFVTQNLSRHRPVSLSYGMRTSRSCSAFARDHGQFDWLCDVFGFTVRLRIGSHRVQLLVNNGLGGEGSVVVTERGEHAPAKGSHSVMVQVADAQGHYEHVLTCGAEIVNPPTDYFFGEKQYTAVDLGGHRWTFSQSIADVDPESWGGVMPKREP